MSIRLDSLTRWKEGSMQLVAREGDQLLGLIDLYHYDPINHRAEVGIVVESRYRHQGYGTLMLKELERYVQQHLLLHQLYCDILEENLVSQKLFEQCGYCHCGTFKEWVTDAVGNYHTVVRYQKFI